VTKTWFVTGASSGFGREWSRAALERGDRVAVAARRLDLLEDLEAEFGSDAVLPIELDVSDRAATFAAIARANEHLDRLDVIVNCAGGGHQGTVEALTEAEARKLMDVNFFGTLWVIQAALPLLRDQGGGRMLLMSSIGGLVANQTLGLYHATRWALEGLCESLTKEVDQFGIKITLLEPTGYRTGIHLHSTSSAPHPAYAREAAWTAERRELVESNGGDPTATRAAILDVVDMEDPPLRLLLGAGLVDLLESAYEARLDSWRAWELVSTTAHGAHP
jgi:NAD(P)-dependent dehydrogenase (short-subunit alcohol dehydrogenase family)